MRRYALSLPRTSHLIFLSTRRSVLSPLLPLTYNAPLSPFSLPRGPRKPQPIRLRGFPSFKHPHSDYTLLSPVSFYSLKIPTPPLDFHSTSLLPFFLPPPPPSFLLPRNYCQPTASPMFSIILPTLEHVKIIDTV